MASNVTTKKLEDTSVTSAIVGESWMEFKSMLELNRELQRSGETTPKMSIEIDLDLNVAEALWTSAERLNLTQVTPKATLLSLVKAAMLAKSELFFPNGESDDELLNSINTAYNDVLKEIDDSFETNDNDEISEGL